MTPHEKETVYATAEQRSALFRLLRIEKDLSELIRARSHRQWAIDLFITFLKVLSPITLIGAGLMYLLRQPLRDWLT